MPESGALATAVTDLYVGSLTQTPPDHSGITGRMTSLFDCEVRHWFDTPNGKRTQLDPRSGYSSLSNVLRDANSGDITSGSWLTPQLLAPLGDHLVASAAGIPRVWNGSSWTFYPSTRVITNKLSQDVFHTSGHTLQAPDGAYLQGVTCMVWTETGYDAANKPLTSSFVGFRNDDGAWIVTPQQLYAPNNNAIRCIAKVVTDGVNFWVFWNDEVAGFRINIAVYDTHGSQLAHTTQTQLWQNTPGYWDVYGLPTGAILAQPGSYNPPNDVHVKFTTLTYSAGTITPTSNTDNTVTCRGPVGFATNDLSGGKVYIITMGNGSPGAIFGYEVDPTTRSATHTYTSSVTPASDPDSLIGWTVDAGSGHRNLFISYGLLSLTPQTAGPKYDPALRSTVTISVAFGGAVNAERTTQSVIPASRAFLWNNDYHAITYYQSGSGLVLTTSPIAVTHAAGDYMTGARIQPLDITAIADFTQGSAFTISPSTGNTAIAPAIGNVNIQAGDTVQPVSAVGLGAFGIPDGTIMGSWKFAGSTFPTGITQSEGQLIVSGSSGVTAANGTYYVYYVDTVTNAIYTTSEASAHTIPSGTFGAAGHFSCTSVATFGMFDPATVGNLIGPNTRQFFIGSTITTTGSGVGGNNGTFTIARIMLPGDVRSLGFLRVSVLQSTQSNSTSSYSATLTPLHANRWNIQSGSPYDSSYVGAKLSITEDTVNAINNNGDFAITAASGTSIDTSGSAIVAEVFQTPVPQASITLPGNVQAYTFKLQNLTLSQQLVGGLIALSGSAFHTPDDGTYVIDTVDQAAGLLYTHPSNGLSNQVNQAFGGGETITVYPPVQTDPQTQPLWFITPLAGTQPQVGCFERGLAYADWRFEGETGYFGPNNFPLAVSSVVLGQNSGKQVLLPYRAVTFTASQLPQIPNGLAEVDQSVFTDESTVGIKRFSLSLSVGQPVAMDGELMLPGPMASEYTSSGFHEQGINVSPEAPFNYAAPYQDSTVVGLSLNSVYTYQVVARAVDENGQTIFSVPSATFQQRLTGTANTAQIAWRLINPLSSTGAPTGDAGLSNRAVIVYDVFRSVMFDGVPTTQLYRVTNPLNPNGVVTLGSTGTGFAFPDAFTAVFQDQTPDAIASANETVYAGSFGQGNLPRFPAPPFSQGTTWANRFWVVGYDGAVWMSGERQEGQGAWFFPGFRFPFTPENPAVCVAPLENYLLVFRKRSISYIPLAQFPNSTGTVGSLPTPVDLQFPNGGTGFAVKYQDSVAYSSTAGTGQVWAITRSLENVYLSEPVEDTLNSAVTGMAVDDDQRLYISQGTQQLVIWDAVPKEWYVHRMPSSTVFITSWLGLPAYLDSLGFLLYRTPGIYQDVLNGVSSPINPDYTFSKLSFAQVRAVKRWYEGQLVGLANADCFVNVQVSYPDSPYGQPTDTFRQRINLAAPFLLAFNPLGQEESTFQVRVFADHSGIVSFANSFSLELIGCELGVDVAAGVNKLPDSFRLLPT